MNDEQLLKFYSKAESDLSMAREELQKPEEDVVNYSACIMARSSVYHYLGCLYLLHSNEEDHISLEKGTKTIDELIGFAGKHYEEVNELDFSSMRCTCKDIKSIRNNEEIYFCNNTDIVRNCSDLAEQVRDLVVNNAFEGNHSARPAS